MNYIEGIEKAFKEYIGENSIDKLKETITKKPMILIALMSTMDSSSGQLDK